MKRRYRTRILVCSYLFLVLAGLARAEPQVIIDTDFGATGRAFQEIDPSKSVRITGSLPPGWGDNSNWKSNVAAEYGPVSEGDRRFLRVRQSTAAAFNIASMTKQFTAACIALLVEEGKISLDDDIRRYVPELPAYEAPIQIKHLIYHTSGVRDLAVLSFLKGLAVDETYSEPVLLDLLARQKELNFRPGNARGYSNSGYFLLGLIRQRVTGMSLEAHAEKHLFDPLGMMLAGWVTRQQHAIA